MWHKYRRVALVYDGRLAYDVKVMMGVATYVQEHSNWSVYIQENALKDQRLPNLRFWQADGIITNFDDRKIAAAVHKSKLPAVGFGGGRGWYQTSFSIPYFFANDEAIARLAADHLLKRGLRAFAYCGYPRNAVNVWSQKRARAFAESVGKRGFHCTAYRALRDRERDWVDLQRSLCIWLTKLPKPVGLMAANDDRARHVLEACRTLNLRVPEDVAVIGVDNDELCCQLSSVPLSSVEHGAKQLGYEAAALLDSIMGGRSARRNGS